MGIIAKPLGWLMTWLYGMIGNYALVIILITVAVKIILYPIYKNQILSSANMADMQPKIQEIQRKYAKDKELMNQKLAEFYQEENYNPAKGCLPMVIQMIVIMALFAVLRNPMTYISNEEMYFAIHESFLWIKDLSQPDLWILPILAGVATFLSQWLNKLTNPTMQGSTNMMMTVMMYFFPIMIVWLARSYPSGLALYWFVSQFIQVFFNLRLNQIRKKIVKEKTTKKAKK
ncbi:MAG: membrane protein insertase YidC [Firmicutes bacterium]|nr:membrane protein insertase YidC [Bacillota bacterium]